MYGFNRGFAILEAKPGLGHSSVLCDALVGFLHLLLSRIRVFFAG